MPVEKACSVISKVELVDNDSSEKLISVDDLEKRIILLPWYQSEESGGTDSDSGCDEIKELGTEPVSLQWYPSETDGGTALDLECDGIRNLGSQILLLPWYSCEAEGRAELKADNYNDVNYLGTETEGSAEACTSTSPWDNIVSHFVGMGFPKKIVMKTLEENGEDDTYAILETLLAHAAVDKNFRESDDVPCDFSDLRKSDSYPEDEENVDHSMDKERNLLHLIDMGFPVDEAFSAVEASGPETSLAELMDYIYASQASRSLDPPLQEPVRESIGGDQIVSIKKRKLAEGKEIWKRNVDTLGEKASRKKNKVVYDDMRIHTPKNMIGFGVPNIPSPVLHRKIPEAAVGPPYFYYENVAFTPKGVWSTISRFLFEIEPEFVDSLHFSAAARKRGYVHNLPLENRFPLEPIPPLTIQEAFPLTKKWWPSWDDRKKLNCVVTNAGRGKLAQELGDILDHWKDALPKETQKYILYECKKGNLIWVGKNKLASLEPDEMEFILGYPKNHTRGGRITRSDRYKSLGNTFQVDTVAYHFSVLKNIFPNGMNVLSLFSGIGGAEVALHRLGIPLNNVVSVEISEVNRNIIRSWWEQTNQKGNLFELKDVQELNVDKLKHFVDSFGGFDLVVGGSPCNNLAGNNRVSREGLQGEQSVLFYDYFRILNDVKFLMGRKK